MSSYLRRREAPADSDRQEPEMPTKEELDAIEALMPGLYMTRVRLLSDGWDPSRVILPERVKPKDVTGHATVFGLPIIWGDRAGLVVDA